MIKQSKQTKARKASTKTTKKLSPPAWPTFQPTTEVKAAPTADTPLSWPTYSPSER